MLFFFILQRYLRDQLSRPDVGLLDGKNFIFSDIQNSLDARMKQLTRDGLNVVTSADPVNNDDEEVLWRTGIINKETAKGLSNGVFLYNGKLFAVRGGEEHRKLDLEQFEIIKTTNGKILRYTARGSKNVQGGIKQKKVKPRIINQHSDTTNPRCVVDLYERYFAALNVTTGPFYRRPLAAPAATRSNTASSIVFSSQAIGVNSLQKYLTQMFHDAGIADGGRTIRNHSTRVTCCTDLHNKGFDDESIRRRSGHRSNVLQDYKRSSLEMDKRVSDALQPPPPKVPKTDPVQAPASQLSTSGIDQEDRSRTMVIEIPTVINHVVIRQNGQDSHIFLQN